MLNLQRATTYFLFKRKISQGGLSLLAISCSSAKVSRGCSAKSWGLLASVSSSPSSSVFFFFFAFASLRAHPKYGNQLFSTENSTKTLAAL